MKAEVDQHTGETWIHLDKEEVRYGFLSQCIEAAASAEGCDYIEMLSRMENVNMTKGYILAHYDILHTESMENIVADLIDVLQKREYPIRNSHV